MPVVQDVKRGSVSGASWNGRPFEARANLHSLRATLCLWVACPHGERGHAQVQRCNCRGRGRRSLRKPDDTYGARTMPIVGVAAGSKDAPDTGRSNHQAGCLTNRPTCGPSDHCPVITLMILWVKNSVRTHRLGEGCDSLTRAVCPQHSFWLSLRDSSVSRGFLAPWWSQGS